MAYRILVGDVLARLRSLAGGSVHCVVTSPPYWGLRDYDLPPSVWGGDLTCEHEWLLTAMATEVGRGNWAQGVNGRGEVQPGGVAAKREPIRSEAQTGFCQKCGAWLGCLGLEPTPQLFTEHVVEVFREVRRVLRKDGTCWVNMGDCYATGAGKVGDHPGGGKQGADWKGFRGDRNGHEGIQDYSASSRGTGAVTQPNRMPIAGLKPKDLCGMPWRVAFALQADGWWLRQDIIWAKPNPMPESVTDRCTKAHEYLFLLTKSARYYYDAEAIKEPAIGNDPGNLGHAYAEAYAADDSERFRTKAGLANVGPATTRNKRSVWEIATETYSEAHFATFPTKLVEPCILAGTSEKGVCEHCGTPWLRVMECYDTGKKQKMTDGWAVGDYAHGSILEEGRRKGEAGKPVLASQTTGWKPGCTCAASAIPATVLDPFSGAGTTGLVATRLGRNYLGIELNPEYAAMSRRRIQDDNPLFNVEVETNACTDLFPSA